MTYEELSQLVHKSGDEIYRFCYNLEQDKAKAEDLYQETFLKALERIEKIDSSDNPKSFLISISIGIWKNNRKKYARRQRIAPGSIDSVDISTREVKDCGLTPEEICLSNERKCVIQAKTQQLSEKYRLVLYMYYSMELPVKQISKILHIPVGTVKSRLIKSRKMIKKELEECGYAR